MASVTKIIDDHKGKIEVESRVGVGTTIRFMIPIDSSPQ
jgi:signal transduction histidine kinase